MTNCAFLVRSCDTACESCQIHIGVASRSTTSTRPEGQVYLDVVCYNGHVLEVQSCINLIHEVEWRGAEIVQRKNKAQRAQSFLAATEVGDVLPRLSGRPTRSTVHAQSVLAVQPRNMHLQSRAAIQRNT